MTSPASPLPPTQRELACPISLTGRARSASAEDLVHRLVDEVVLPCRATSDRRKQAGEATRLKLRTATTALLADLMNLARPSGAMSTPLAGAHGMSRSHFQADRLGFGYDMFIEVIRALEAEGLLVRRVGYPKWGAPKGERQGAATCFLMTDALWRLAGASGVTSGDWEDHWTLKPRQVLGGDQKRLELRKRRKMRAGVKLASEDHPFDRHEPRAAELDAQIERINEYLLSHDIDGLAFHGLRRIFNDGDQPDFVWNKGGRFYSIRGGQAYERWNADLRQRLITINGERVVEVDLKASHLTLLHALSGEPFDPSEDPYEVEDLPRIVVKLWVAQAIGASNPLARKWSKTSQANYDEERPGQWLDDDFPIREVAADVKARHPLLIDVGVLGYSTLALQYHEAEILRLAMERLMFSHDTPALPIHDALIVPHTRTQEAERCLKEAFKDYVEGVTGRACPVEPNVTLKEG